MSLANKIGSSMTNKEIWKPIKGYENSYQVSSWGRIRSLDRFVFKGSDKVKSIQKGQIIKPWLNSDGYLRVCLCKKGFKKYKKVHRLVAETFIPNPKNKLTVNHINEVATDNNVNNLEWMTNEENINYGHRIENIKNTMSWKIKQIKNKTVVNIFNSLHEAEETTKIPRQSISYAVKHGTHLKNYMWERG